MVLKHADDRSGDVAKLGALAEDPRVAAEARRRIEQELKFLQAGIKGEKDAAYEIDFNFAKTANWIVLHDLRIEVDGRVAQIDHILVNRFLEVWVCESKRFGEGISINEHGEFSAFFGGRPYGVPSPIEQNRKHVTVLASLFESGRVELPRRLGFAMKPVLRSLVLVSKNARISRPKAPVDGLADIIKVDQLRSFLEDEKKSGPSVLSTMKLIGTDTLEQFGRSLMAAHTPIQFDWEAKFGIEPAPAPEPAEPTPAAGQKTSKLVCATCNAAVAYNVARFCWFNKARFGGAVYCMECQKQVPAGGSGR